MRKQAKSLAPAMLGSGPPSPEGPGPTRIEALVERPRVLVVDDDERNLLAITTVIEDVADVVLANSGEEALRQLLKFEFAVILLDVYMPGIDGYETARLIRAREQTKRVPIVFLSAVNKEMDHLLRGYAMGAVDYVFKPVEPVVLRSKVAVFVDLFAMTKEIQRKALQEQKLLDANLRANAEKLEIETQLNQVRKMDAIGQLTGGIAHDFNNLLAAVLGGLGMIERRVPLNEEQRELVGMTRHAAEQGAELVKHLLAFSRRQKLEPGPVDMVALETSVTNLLAHTLGGMVELQWKREPDVACAYADAAQLELALMNLIINSRDAMPDGGTITVSASNRLATDTEPNLKLGNYIVLCVTDTGSGIAPDMIEQIMEPFFTTKAIGKGTGLGLSMVYGFVKQSGGSIRVRSELGIGTCIELWLPAALPEVPLVVNAGPSEIGESDQEGSLKILLVDDHPGVRATTAAMLADLGHEVFQADEGATALDMMRANPDGFDLVLSDYAMPRLSGAELIRQLRSIRPGLPAIIVTGYAEPDSALVPADDVPVLVKPFDTRQLRYSLLKARGDGLNQ